MPIKISWFSVISKTNLKYHSNCFLISTQIFTSLNIQQCDVWFSWAFWITNIIFNFETHYLSRHNFSIRARNFDARIEHTAIMRFQNVSPVHFIGAYATIVRSWNHKIIEYLLWIYYFWFSFKFDYIFWKIESTRKQMNYQLSSSPSLKSRLCNIN